MPSAAFEQLFERILSDDAFAKRIEAEHESVLDEYELTQEDRDALMSLDAERVVALGVDERVSKRFGGSDRWY